MFRYYVNPSGPTVASVAALKDGSFLEIVRDCEYQKEKRVFKDYNEWLATLPAGGFVLDTPIKSPFKEPKAPEPPAPVDESLKDVPYLMALKQKYGIRTKPNPHKKGNLFNLQLAKLKDDLEKNTELLGNKKDPLHQFSKYQDLKLRNEIADMEARLANNPEVATKTVYNQPVRKQAIALIQVGTRYAPLAYHSSDHVLIFNGKSGKTFEEVGLPPRPELWMQKGQRIFKAV